MVGDIFAVFVVKSRLSQRHSCHHHHKTKLVISTFISLMVRYAWLVKRKQLVWPLLQLSRMSPWCIEKNIFISKIKWLNVNSTTYGITLLIAPKDCRMRIARSVCGWVDTRSFPKMKNIRIAHDDQSRLLKLLAH